MIVLHQVNLSNTNENQWNPHLLEVSGGQLIKLRQIDDDLSGLFGSVKWLCNEEIRIEVGWVDFLREICKIVKLSKVNVCKYPHIGGF